MPPERLTGPDTGKADAMSDPATNPDLDLVDSPQDEPQPRARLGTVLALMRVLAGRRGDAAVTWQGQGFSYHLSVVRGAGAPAVDLELDPTAPGADEARVRIVDALS
jgi:hypothetical protein